MSKIQEAISLLSIAGETCQEARPRVRDLVCKCFTYYCCLCLLLCIFGFLIILHLGFLFKFCSLNYTVGSFSVCGFIVFIQIYVTGETNPLVSASDRWCVHCTYSWMRAFPQRRIGMHAFGIREFCD